jgi:hypothetical protein
LNSKSSEQPARSRQNIESKWSEQLANRPRRRKKTWFRHMCRERTNSKDIVVGPEWTVFTKVENWDMAEKSGARYLENNGGCRTCGGG